LKGARRAAAAAVTGFGVVALAILLAAGCRGREVGPFADAPILLVSIDTLRADHLAAYGYRAGRTPRLDALARDGVVFEDVYSHCPLTLPAHASLFTGLLPPHHGVRDNLGFALDPSRRTLAARYHAAGVATGGAVSAYVLRRATGIGAGFDWFDDAIPIDITHRGLAEQQRDGAITVEAVSSWIEARGGQRFFAFLHLYEPHTPYTPPPAYRDLGHPYDGEIAYADELIGRLVDRLAARGILDRAIVAVTSDHGEGLGDHGEAEHGLFVYRESVRVPWILRLPGRLRAGTRVSGVVAQADIAPTLLDLSGLEARGMDGISRRAAVAGTPVAARPVYSETLFPHYHFGWSELLAATDERLRYIRAPRPELYDVRDDPGEKRNLVASWPQAAAGLQTWVEAQAGGAPPAPAAVPLDLRERMQALGYLGSGPAPSALTGPAADPKDRVAAYEAFRAATGLRQEGRDAEAVAALEKVLASDPGMLDAREVLGECLFHLGRTRDAIAALQAVLERDPERASAHLALARLYAIGGNRAEMERHAARAAGAEPGKAFEMLAEATLAARRMDDAEAFARRAVAADPERVIAHYVLGLVAASRGKCEEALGDYGRADQARQRQQGLVVPGLQARIGECLARLGREAEAERAFQAEIAAQASSVDGRMGLAILYRSQGRDEAAREALAGIVTANPQAGANEYWTVVRSLAGLGDAPAAREWATRARERFPNDKRFR